MKQVPRGLVPMRNGERICSLAGEEVVQKVLVNMGFVVVVVVVVGMLDFAQNSEYGAVSMLPKCTSGQITYHLNLHSPE